MSKECNLVYTELFLSNLLSDESRTKKVQDCKMFRLNNKGMEI